MIAQFAGQQFSGFKTALADLTVAKLEPITAEMRRLLADPAEIDRILKDGAQKARAIATPMMDEVKKTVGLHHLKNVLVTGAAKRLGRAIALDLAAAGWNVALHYHGSAEDADSAAAGMRAPWAWRPPR